ncbi:MAG: DUF1846 domain-containing protein [Pontiellaceae bacterium]|jgi:uncharacterized protein (UPF0371 family)|nr:DUF1846 domain-containing protein [Pontiellaceae bacterium]
MNKVGFDNEKYLDEQSACIIQRAERFHNKLYLEFGGKLMFDYHAARILPGFDPNVKIRLLHRLRDRAEIILCIYAGDIERKKIRADFGITYDADMLRLMDDLREWGLALAGVVITRFDEQPAAIQFRNRLERRGIRVYIHRAIKGYPTDVDRIVSDNGYGANPFIETAKPIVVVSAPGPGSGKMAVCLSQLYHDHRRGVSSGYSKFETFPIWNLPLKHPVNMAYEAATADIGDFNMLDSFHLEAHGEKAVNYNRDIEIFPVLKRILERITGERSIYQSPTDMGVNRAGFAIVNDAAVRTASVQEIIRRVFRYRCDYAQGNADQKTVERIELLLKEAGAEPENRPVVLPARDAARRAEEHKKGREGIFCGAAIELPDGRMVTGCNSPLLHAASSMLLNALKVLAGLPDEMLLLSPGVIESIRHLKLDLLNGKSPSLDLEETLISLSVSAAGNPAAQMAMEKLPLLRGCEVHLSHIPSPGDETGLRRLGVNATSEANFAGSSLYITGS